MAVFKQKRKVRLPNGRTVVRQSAKWYIKYRDGDDIVRCVPAFRDKLASQQLEAKLVKEAELAQAGVVDRYKEQRSKPLTEHLADFRQALIAKGNTKDYVDLITSRIGRVICGCKFITWADIQANRIQ